MDGLGALLLGQSALLLGQSALSNPKCPFCKWPCPSKSLNQALCIIIMHQQFIIISSSSSSLSSYYYNHEQYCFSHFYIFIVCIVSRIWLSIKVKLSFRLFSRKIMTQMFVFFFIFIFFIFIIFIIISLYLWTIFFFFIYSSVANQCTCIMTIIWSLILITCSHL